MGANCSVGPAATLDVLQEMITSIKEHDVNSEASPPLFSAQPNAGLPTRIGNRFFYVATPDYFADYALHFTQAGVRLIGGCCGTTPRHIAAMRQALDERYGSLDQSAAPAPAREKITVATNGQATIARLIEEEVILPQEGYMTSLQEKFQA